MSIKLISTVETPIEFFMPIIEDELAKIFRCDINNLPENYGRKTNWSLLNLIELNQLDMYQLIYVDDKFWVGSGGIIRNFQDESIYQGGFRGFSSTRSASSGMGSYSYVHKFNTTQQIERAKYYGCKKFILSFNTHNERLYKITRDYHLPKVFGKNAFVDSHDQIEFNGVNQWLLTMYL